MLLRTAKLKDIPKICRLVNLSYRGKYSMLGWTTEAHILGGQRTDQAKIQEILQDPMSRFELLIHHDRMIGCIHIKKEENGILYFGMLTIHPKKQNRHLGKKLLSHIEQLAIEMGQKKIRMTVIHTRSELITYYQRRGYRLTGQKEQFPLHDPRFGLPKRNDLYFLEMLKDL